VAAAGGRVDVRAWRFDGVARCLQWRFGAERAAGGRREIRAYDSMIPTISLVIAHERAASIA